LEDELKNVEDVFVANGYEGRSGPYWKSHCELGPLSKYYDK
jgi:hypothetical protein